MTGGIVVAGASAGGVEALRGMVAGLPTDLGLPVVVVLHIPRSAPSALPAILRRAGRLPAEPVADGVAMRPGTVYVAPANHHVLVADGHLRLSHGPSENGHRPAIDPLFRSAALAYGPGAIGVVLSGTRDDGTAGLAAIAAQGGVALVQDPGDALYPGMPTSALEHVPGAQALPAVKLGALVAELAARRSAAVAPEAPDLLTAEAGMAALSALTTPELDGATPSGLSCPDCNGVLFELPGEPAPRFRCRVGHAWSPASLLEAQSSDVDAALWVALRALEEKAELARRLAEGAERAGRAVSAGLHRARAVQAETAAAQVRTLIGRGLTDEEER